MRTLTKEEANALEELGLSNTVFDSPRMTVEAFDDLIRLCVIHARISDLEHWVEQFDDNDWLGGDQ